MTSYTTHFDIAYVDAESSRQALDLYLPAAPASALPPLLVYIHGALEGRLLAGSDSTGDSLLALWLLGDLVSLL